MHRSLTPLAVVVLTALPALVSAGWDNSAWTGPTTQTAAPRATTCAAPVNTAGYGETEPNGTKENADPLTAGIPMLGQNYATGDIDWYYFQTTSANEVFTMSFTAAGLAAGETGTWRMKLEDANGTTLAQRDAVLSGTAYVEALQATLANPGYYFVSITPVEHSDTTYSILSAQTVSSQPAATPPPAAVVFRRDSRRLRMPVVEVQDADGSVGYFDATMEYTGGTTFELTDAVPLN